MDFSGRQPQQPGLNSFLAVLDHQSARMWIGCVFLVAILERLGLWWLYRAIPYSDTPSYRRLAESILRGFSRYNGTRTPGYPLLLAVFGPDDRVWLAQMGMGVATTFLLFYIGWQLSGRAWFGGLVGLAHTLNLGQLLFEANLLTETASTFCVILALAGAVYWLYHPRKRSLWLGIGIGLAASLAWLTRPLFIYLPFWLLFFLILPSREGRSSFSGRAVTGVVAFTLCVLFVLSVWVGFIHDRFHEWSLTTMTGYNLIQHTGEFFELVPDQYAELRDTYLKYRDAHIAQYGTQTNTIWAAIPEMQEVSGKSFYDLSRLLARISVQLIREHPDLYLKNVLQGWWMFWRSPVYWVPESFQTGVPVGVLGGIVLIERIILFGVNMVFVVTSLLAVFWHRARSAWRVNPGLWCILGTVWIASVLQTLIDHGDNPRFLVPLQSLVVLWVLWLALQMLVSRAKRNPR